MLTLRVVSQSLAMSPNNLSSRPAKKLVGAAGLKFASPVDTLGERNIINEHTNGRKHNKRDWLTDWTMNDTLSQDNAMDQVTCRLVENNSNVVDFPLPTSQFKQPYVLKHDKPYQLYPHRDTLYTHKINCTVTNKPFDTIFLRMILTLRGSRSNSLRHTYDSTGDDGRHTNKTLARMYPCPGDRTTLQTNVLSCL